VEWDEARLLPSALNLGVTGIAGLMLALAAAVEGNPFAPLVLIAGIVLLAASRLLEPGRRWSLVIGSRAAVIGIFLWLGVAAATHDANRPVQAAFSIALAASSLWVSRFLNAELEPPPWASWDAADSEPDPEPPPARLVGWIEELPTEPIR
jgi:hypothetical protein